MDLSGLNPAQVEAVMHRDGPCCVVAGAGSGKTRVLVHRIALLIEEVASLSPKNILAVTFTRKAAAEMQERLYALIGAAAEDVNMGTFHSICYRILREEWRSQGIYPYEPVQESWQKRIIRKILAPPGKDNPWGMNWNLDASSALSWISWQKNNLITPDGELERTVTPEKHRQLYRLYEELKEREHKLDFDDMLLWCYRMLQYPAVREKWAGQFRYILVDECLPYECPILLADGRLLPIGEIVESKLPVEVLSYNEKTGEQEAKPIVGYHKIPRTKPMWKIVVLRKAQGVGKNEIALVATEDHRVSTNRGWLPISKIRVGDIVQIESTTANGEVIAVEPVKVNDSYLYDVTVADNHNYYANGILVHNCQDTNFAQQEILKQLAYPLNNVFVVGDARQSIYGFRGAKPEFVLRFEQKWPKAKIIVLDINYRSTDNIVRFSNQLIGRASIEYPGICQANREAADDPIFIRAGDEDKEAHQIAEEIKALVTGQEPNKMNNYTFGSIAVLYRTNAQARALEDALIRAQIPYIVCGTVGFYRRKEIKDILAYLRIVVDPDDTEAIARVLNVPPRFLGKAFLQKAQEYAHKQGIPLLQALGECPEADQWKYRQVRDFLWCIETLRRESAHSPAGEMVMRVRQVTGYDAWLLEEEGAEEENDTDRLENLNALAGAAWRFDSLEEFLNYAEQVGSRSVEENGGDKVALMTIHKAKGLEFPVVFVAGLSNGLLPHRKAIQCLDGEVVPESIEEERRLCYVAMTRAKDRLYLSSIEEYQGKPLEQSVFLTDIFHVEP